MFGDFATTNDDVAMVKEDPMLDIDDSKGTTVVEKDDSNSNVVGDSNVSPDNDSKENSKGMEDDMFGDFATTNDDVATVKEEPMLDIDDSKVTTVVEKDDSNSNVVGDMNVSPDNDSKENSKGMEDDMFGVATTNDDVATVKEEPMLDIDDLGTTVVEKDDDNNVGSDTENAKNNSVEKRAWNIRVHVLLTILTTLVPMKIRAREMKMRQRKILRMVMHLMMMTLANLVLMTIQGRR